MPNTTTKGESELRVGEFIVRPADGTLRRGGDVERLEPKTMELLVCLAAHPGQVLSREAIQAAVWPDTAIADVVLPRVVFDLRRALGDDAKHPRYIETLPRRGYRLIARVAPRRGRRRLSLPRIAAGLAVLVLAGPVLLSVRQGAAPRPPGATAGHARTRIVVLPFENVGAADDAWFAAGMTEEITAQLAGVPGLGVISRTSAMRYANGGTPLARIGRELDVAWALEGSVLWEPAQDLPRRLRVAARLVRIADDTPVWSARFDRELVDVLALQRQIARSVAARLGHELTSVGGPAVPTANLEAWRAYVRGLAHAGGTQSVRSDSIELATDLFARAVDLDPQFALAWAELSRAHSWQHHLGHDVSPARCEQSRTAARRALELEPALPRAALALGDVLYRCDRDYAAALRAYARALQARPDDASLRAAAAYVQRRQGRFREALDGLQEAVSLDPLSGNLAVDVGQTHLALRQYEAARAQFRRAIELEPDLEQAWVSAAGVLVLAQGDAKAALAVLAARPGGMAPCEQAELEYLAGQLDRAAATLSGCKAGLRLPAAVWPGALIAGWVHDARGDAGSARHAYAAAREQLGAELRRSPEDFRLHEALGLELAGLGQADEAVRSGRRALELFPPQSDAMIGPALLLQLAWIHARLGRSGPALDLVEQLLAMPAGNWISPLSASVDPRLARLRGEPRFQALVSPARPSQ